MYTILQKSYSAPKVNVKEILRYAGVKEGDGGISELLKECLIEVENELVYRVCYAEFNCKIYGEIIDLEFVKINSKNLSSNLKNANKCIVFCATIGAKIDRLIAKYSVISPLKALLFQAIGAERIESLCNLFNNEIKQSYNAVKPRFSPGYGDLRVELQREIIEVLGANKRIGVTLNESLLMSPSKSVTAFIGANSSEK
ncbi:MAG: Vitamin B12 dependent methionine synthase activation subunit [Clostridia bacterium]|nr:Vitamin B12 dependent methionine synthase activation subunit [Clostridia bacterium]